MYRAESRVVDGKSAVQAVRERRSFKSLAQSVPAGLGGQMTPKWSWPMQGNSLKKKSRHPLQSCLRDPDPVPCPKARITMGCPVPVAGAVVVYPDGGRCV